MHRPVGSVFELDKGCGDEGGDLSLRIIKETIGGQIVLRIPENDIILEMNVFGVFEVDAPVTGKDRFLVDDLASMIVSADPRVHIIVQVLGRQDTFAICQRYIFIEVDELFIHQVFHVVRVDIGRVVVIDMNMIEAFDVVFVGVHDEAVAVDQCRFLLDPDVADEDSETSHRIHLFEAVPIRVEDLHLLHAIAARRLDGCLHLRPGREGEQKAADE